jgi:hypothetical protein
MRPWVIAAIAVTLAGPALAFDGEAGVPLQPSEAAGAWSLQTGKHDRTLCVLNLGQRRTNVGYALRIRGDCGAALSAQPVAWAPTSDGMRLVAADGGTVLSFDRWSNSLFTTHTDSPVDLQLRRGL